MDNIIFMDKFDDYSSKDEEKEREIEDFNGLRDALEGNLNHRLSVLLSGNEIADLIESTTRKRIVEFSSSERGKHGDSVCKGVKRETEREICKCMFYHDRQSEGKCPSCCAIKQPWTNISKRYEVVDYEFPMPFKHGLRHRNVDLVLKDILDGKYYAVEVKPPRRDNKKPNKNTISRMMAETLTYTALLEFAGDSGLKDNKRLQPAIAFFKDSIQYDKFKHYNETLKDPNFEYLVRKIKVFVIDYKEKNEAREFSIAPYDE